MKLIALTTAVVIGVNCLSIKTLPPSSVQDKAEQAGITEEEFILLSSVVEAESDRSESIDGRVLIALTVLNRVDSNLFPDTITEVLTAPNQFATVVNGRSVTQRTDLSDEAVLQAIEWNATGEDPNVLFFNCVGYNYGTPYDYVDGNYFMTMEEEE